MVWDTDREKEKIKHRNLIREQLDRQAAHDRVVGVCVEELEAWLLADGGAFRKTFGRGPAQLPGSPESLSDPKKALTDVLNGFENVGPLNDALANLASNVDLETLRNACPKGYGELRDDLRTAVERFGN
jgi:hypothetical protein